MKDFKINSKLKPMGDQPKAIDELVNSINSGNKYQTLLGVTGSGKTFTMANVIERLQRPALVLAHNKILAAQLCSEIILLSILCPIMIIISQRPMFLKRIH